MPASDLKDLKWIADLGIAMTEARQDPEVPIYDHIRQQLLYVQRVIGTNFDVFDPDVQLTFGTLAVRNFEELDPEYAEVLTWLSYRLKQLSEERVAS